MSGPLATSPEAQCAEAERRLQEYVDRVLTATEIRAIESHLAVCDSCARCYRLETEMRAQVRRVCSEPCPEAVKVRLRSLCTECDCE
jgi:anti-sigma factor (TIGR02949 family)